MSDQGVPQLNTPFVQADTLQVAIPWYEFLIALWNRTNGGVGSYNSSMHVGQTFTYAGTGDLPGALLTDGSAVLITDYPALFDAIGLAFGVPPAGSFLLPNIPPAGGISTYIKY